MHISTVADAVQKPSKVCMDPHSLPLVQMQIWAGFQSGGQESMSARAHSELWGTSRVFWAHKWIGTFDLPHNLLARSAAYVLIETKRSASGHVKMAEFCGQCTL